MLLAGVAGLAASLYGAMDSSHGVPLGLIVYVVSSLTVLVALACWVLALRRRSETDRIELWSALERQRSLYEMLLDQTTAVVFVKDASFSYLYVNRQFEQNAGMSREEICGKSDFDLFPKEIAEAMRANDERVLETELPLEVEELLSRPDGFRTFQSVKVPMRDQDGKLFALCGVATDITDVKRLHLERERASRLEGERRQARERSRHKSAFVAALSHELRTPLNAMIGFAELMKEGMAGPVSPAQREYLGDVLSSGNHLVALIGEVLDLSKIEAGLMSFRPAEVRLEELAMQVRDAVQAASETAPNIEIRVDPALTTARLDPARLKQVLLNFLSNAVKFSPPHERIRLRLQSESGGWFRVEVEDRGPGIAREDQHRLWREFQQIEREGARARVGTGLGLALTRQIVLAQGGEVGVRSEPGQGSLFWARLPLRGGKLGEDTTDAIVGPIGAPPSTGRRTVLVVDEDARDRARARRVLANAGFSVVEARSAHEARRLASETAFDAIALDLLLAESSGVEVLDHIRRSGPNRDTPIVVLTESEAGEVSGVLVRDVMSKSAGPERLLEALRRGGLSPGEGGGLPVMVVDDDEAIRSVMRSTLEHLGYRPLCVPDGETALAVATAHSPRVVIVDLGMPEMDGFQFLEKFRALDAGRNVHVIVWTSRVVTDADRSRLAGRSEAIVAKGESGLEDLLEELTAHLPPRSRESNPEIVAATP